VVNVLTGRSPRFPGRKARASERLTPESEFGEGSPVVRIEARGRRRRNPRRVILVWSSAALILIGVMGFEIVPTTDRGPWAVLILLTLIGGLLRLGTAALFGFVTFLTFGLYLFWRGQTEPTSHLQVLLLLALPIAPLIMSTLRQVLDEYLLTSSGMQGNSDTAGIGRDGLPTVDTMQAIYPMLHRAMRRRGAMAALIAIDLTNDSLSRQLLGDQAYVGQRRDLVARLAEGVQDADWMFTDTIRNERFYLLVEGDEEVQAACLNSAIVALRQVSGVIARVSMSPILDGDEDLEGLIQTLRPLSNEVVGIEQPQAAGG